MPDIEETAPSKQLLDEKIAYDENPVIPKKASEEATIEKGASKAPEKPVHIRSKTQKEVFTRHQNSGTVNRMRPHKIPSRFPKNTCIRPSKQTAKMNSKILEIRKRTKVDSGNFFKFSISFLLLSNKRNNFTINS